MKYSIINHNGKLFLKEFNRMISPVGLEVHPTILEEYTSYYHSVDVKLRVYDVDDTLYPLLMEKLNAGITDIVLDGNLKETTYEFSGV